MSQIQLHADAGLNAVADAGLRPSDIDGIATAGETPVPLRIISASRPNGSTAGARS
jgi:3-oxoacyl-[acyl-carrier-protein] synthase III